MPTLSVCPFMSMPLTSQMSEVIMCVSAFITVSLSTWCVTLADFHKDSCALRRIYSTLWHVYENVSHHMLGASVPLISRKSYLSSNKKSLKTRAMVSPGSERIDHVQSRLLSYSAGYPGLVIEPAVPLKVPPHAPSAGERQ